MSGYQKSKQSPSDDTISDQACTRCRERKIRCGRELPQCNNCERDDSVTCVYQNPTKRVNHLKSLFDSVNGVKERLINIESHLGRLAVSIEQNMEQDNSCSGSGSSALQASRTGILDADEDEDGPTSPEPYSDDCTNLQVFRHEVDMGDYYHGPLSLFVLCKQFQCYAVSRSNAECGASLRDMLQTLCDRAGVLEPFPPYGGQSVVNLLPKYQATTVISHFLQHVDCATDVFVKSNLFAHIERIYSQSTEPGDDVWPICFQAITVLVWGMEISAQGRNGLFGDFARSLLPSRAALVNSRLLTTPKLVNVQTLILLSIAAQQFDPPGWAEFIFANACGLARTMGLHHAQLFPPETSTYEKLERAKVLQSLYVRDKSLCTTRGSISWLPTHDCNLVSQLSAAIELQVPYDDTLQLAMIQDDIYHLTHATPFRTGKTSKSQTAKRSRSIEHQLDQYIQTFGLFTCRASAYNSRLTMLTMEFLNTRILALQLGSEPGHAERVRSDARASCLLLLIAHGIQDRQVMDNLDALTFQKTTGHQNQTSSSIKASTASFASVLDAFSLPAFFILLKDCLLSQENDNGSSADLELLRRVSTCYINSTESMQSNSYHRKVAWTFEQLLTICDMIKNPNHLHHHDFFAQPSMSNMILSLNTQTNNYCSIPPSRPMSDESGFSFLSQPTGSTPFSWDMGPSMPTSLGIHKHFGSADSAGSSETNLSNIQDQLRQSSSNGSPERSISWSEISPEPHATRKRLRTHEESDMATEKNGELYMGFNPHTRKFGSSSVGSGTPRV